MLTLPASLIAMALLLALAVDRWWGEPPLRLHPVVWMGNYLGWAGRLVQQQTVQTENSTPDYKVFWLAALAWCAGAAIVIVATSALQEGVFYARGTLNPWLAGALQAVVLGVLLKSMLAWAMLKSEVLAVEKALNPAQGGSLAAGRERLSWLVSRGTTGSHFLVCVAGPARRGAVPLCQYCRCHVGLPGRVQRWQLGVGR